MYGRIVRFKDVDLEKMAQMTSEIEGSDPPEGVDSTGFELFVDEAQKTAVFVAYFETEQKLRDADAVFDAMDASDTPGTRVSVDNAEIKIQRSIS